MGFVPWSILRVSMDIPQCQSTSWYKYTIYFLPVYSSLVLRLFSGTSVLVYKIYIDIYIRIEEKHLQCEKLLGLAGGNTKKHGNKKSGESITPIRYNVIQMNTFVVFHAINSSNLSHWWQCNVQFLHAVHWETILIIDCSFSAS